MIDIPSILVHERGKAVARERSGVEGRSLKHARHAPSRRAQGTSGRSGSAGRCSGPSRGTAGSRTSRRGRSAPGGVRAICPRCRRRRSASGGRAVTSAREAILARFAAVSRGRPAAPVVAARLSPRRGARRRGGDRARFVERVRDYGATVVVTADPRAAAAEALAGCRRRARGGRSRISTPICVPTGVELVEDDVLAPVSSTRSTVR